MPYFKRKDGAKGYTNNEEFMALLEECGYVRLKGKELFLHIIWTAMKTWGLPATAAFAIRHFGGNGTVEFVIALFIFAIVQRILD